MPTDSADSSAAPRVLPRGRHRLSRETVLASQRDRIVESIAQLCAEKGYAAVTIADIVARAGIAKHTFYVHFRDKEHCYLEAYDEFARDIIDAMTASIPGAHSPKERYGRAIDAFVEVLSREPATAKAFLVEVLAAGDEARLRRAQVLRMFASAMVNWREEAREHWPQLPAMTPMHALAAVGAVHELLYDAALTGGSEAIVALKPELVEVGAIVGGVASIPAD